MSIAYYGKENQANGQLFIYLVRCKHGTYNAGYTNDLENRIKMHNSRRGANYLRGRAPVELVYAKEYRFYKNALSAERSLNPAFRPRGDGPDPALYTDKEETSP